MAQRIVKNNTLAAIPVADVGETIPASGQIVIAPTDYGKWEGSSDIIVHIGSGDVTVNDGTFDLGVSEGTRLIQGGFSRPISSGDDPTIKANVTDATGTTEYDKRLLSEAILGGLDALAAFRRVNTKVRSDGLNALATDATVVVESTFGFDQQPDSFFRIINTGGAGTTWTIDIAGTSNDPSAPDRDLPAFQKVFVVGVSEEGDELKFRDRVIQELNNDLTFRQSCLFKAQNATDRAIVHIYSEAFSASGEFYERPSAGDFQVTIGGAPGDGVVVVGFDNIISRSKPVTITRDIDSPHRLGLFGITGDVNVTPKDLDDLFIQNATDDGTATGDADMTVNGSLGSPVIFRVDASPTTDLFIEELRFYGGDSGIRLDRFLGRNSSLTNGIKVTIKSDDTITEIPLIFTTADFKNKFAFGQGAAGFDLIVASGRDDFIAVFTFANPFLLRVQGTFTVDDLIEIQIRDNLNQVGELEFIAKGFEKEP